MTAASPARSRSASVGSKSARISGRAEFRTGKQALDDDALLNDGFELVVNDVTGVDFLVHVARDYLGSQRKDARCERLVEQAGMISGDFNVAIAIARGTSFGFFFDRIEFGGRKTATEEITSFASDGFNVNELRIFASSTFFDKG